VLYGIADNQLHAATAVCSLFRTPRHGSLPVREEPSTSRQCCSHCTGWQRIVCKPNTVPRNICNTVENLPVCL